MPRSTNSSLSLFAMVLMLVSACEEPKPADATTPASAKAAKTKAAKTKAAKTEAPDAEPPAEASAPTPEGEAKAPVAGKDAARLLLSRGDAEALLGASVEVSARGGEGFAYTSRSPLANIAVDVVAAAPLRALQSGKALVPDLGDAAFFQIETKRNAILQIIREEQGITIAVGFPLGAPPKAAHAEPAKVAIEAAKKVLAAL